MLKSLRSLFGHSGDPSTLTVVPGKPFEWRAKLRLLAIEDTHLVFPGQLWNEGESIGSVIDVSSDEADIGFKKGSAGHIEQIHLMLKANQSVALHRNSEAVVVANDKRQRIFTVLSGGPTAA